MNRRGHKGRTDGNHTEIMDALRKAAMKPVSTASVGDGFGDIVVAYRNLCMVLEVKDGHDKKLTAAEEKFRAEWCGPYAVVTSPEEAVTAVAQYAKRMGVV